MVDLGFRFLLLTSVVVRLRYVPLQFIFVVPIHLPLTPALVLVVVLHAIFAFSVFTHITTELALYLLAEIYRVLKPGGKAIVTFHHMHAACGNGDFHKVYWDSKILTYECEKLGFNNIEHISEPVGQDVLILNK